MNLKNKKILVTGSSGFIGSNLIKKLENIQALVDPFDLKLGNHLENDKELTKFIKGQYDIIFHLAGFSGSWESNLNRKKCFKINVLASVSLLELISKYSPRTKLILSSSRLEYGIPKYLPVDENHPTEPISFYGLTKLLATQMALVYNRRYNLDITIFRTSNVYGSHSNNKFSGYNLINHFMDQAFKNQVLIIFGEGKQLRDYLYVDDLTEAFLKAAQSPKSSGQIYNLGYGKGIEIAQMAKLIVRLAGRGKLVFRPWPSKIREVETGSYVTDITKIKKDLDFAPKISFQEGIKRVITKNENL